MPQARQERDVGGQGPLKGVRAGAPPVSSRREISRIPDSFAHIFLGSCVLSLLGWFVMKGASPGSTSAAGGPLALVPFGVISAPLLIGVALRLTDAGRPQVWKDLSGILAGYAGGTMAFALVLGVVVPAEVGAVAALLLCSVWCACAPLMEWTRGRGMTTGASLASLARVSGMLLVLAALIRAWNARDGGDGIFFGAVLIVCYCAFTAAGEAVGPLVLSLDVRDPVPRARQLDVPSQQPPSG